MNPNHSLSRTLLAGALLAWATVFSSMTLAQPMGAHTGTHGGGHGHEGRGPMSGGPGGVQMLSERALDRVNATPEQRAQIRQIMQTARNDLKAQREAGRGLREESLKLFAQPAVDARAAETLRQQMSAQHDQASKRMLQAMLDASRVLTPEQRKQLADGMKQRRDMMERHQRERRAADTPKS